MSEEFYTGLSRVLDQRNDMFEELTRLRAQQTVLVEALSGIACGSCCETPGCNIDDPKCEAMIARKALATLDVPDPKEG